MKTLSLLLTAAVSLTTFACSATATDIDAETSESALTTWTKVVSCDNGAMVVDVADYPMTPAPGHDPDYRVQAVLRDKGIVDYLVSRGAVTRNPSNSNEAIVPGRVWLSTFHTSKFEGAFSSELPSGITATLKRYGSGIKLTFERDYSGHVCPSFCVSPSDPEYDPTSGVCEGCERNPTRTEVANWWFGSCPVLANVHR